MAEWLPDRLPEDVEAEASLLASLCAPGMEAIAQQIVADLEDRDFVVPRHKATFTGLRSLLDDGMEVNALTLKARLEKLGILQDAGGFLGVTEIMGSPEVGRPQILSARLKDLSTRRKIISVASSTVREASDPVTETPDLLHDVQVDFANLTRGASALEIEAVSSMLDYIQEGKPFLPQHRRERMGVFGVKCLDDDIIIPPAEPVAIAARPGVGKTVCGVQICKESKERLQAVPLFISLELTKPKLLARFAANFTGVPQSVWRKGEYQDRQAAEIYLARDMMDGIYAAYPDQGVQWGVIEGLVRRAVAQLGVDLVVIDYFSFIGRPALGRGTNEAYAFARVQEGITALTKNLEIGMVVLHQLKGSSDASQYKRPNASDFADTDRPYRDSNIALLMWQDAQGNRKAFLAKNREGVVGKEYNLKLDGAINRFTEDSRQTESINVWRD